MDGLKTSDNVSVVATCRATPASSVQLSDADLAEDDAPQAPPPHARAESLADLDEALLRPGRLGTRLKLEFPDVADRRAILTNKAETMPFNAAARCFLDVVADETSGLSGADLHALCHSD